VEAKAVRTLAEVKSLYKVIDYAFYALGLNAPDSELAPTNGGGEEFTSPVGFGVPEGFRATSPPSDGPASPMSPSGNFRARRLKMAAASSGRNTYRAGISASTLGAFMGSIQSGSADLIQQYVAFMNSFQQKAARGEADISYALSSSMHEPEEDVIGAYPDADNDIAETAHAITERRNMKLIAQDTEGALRMLMSPGALGPSEPPGRTRTSIASSALMAALTIDTNKLTTSDGVPYDDETRPLSIAELKLQASRHFETDPNVKSLKLAANAAAAVLVNATSKVQSK
jgi:peptidoglycan hydrolase-like protein with peptidoglycan-binding domain